MSQKFSVPTKLAVRHISAASSGRRDGFSHVFRESQPARKNAWTTPHNAAASSMHGDPRNTSCAADRASRVGSPGDKSGLALSECWGGPSFDCLGRISGIQKGKSMTGLLAFRHEIMLSRAKPRSAIEWRISGDASIAKKTRHLNHTGPCRRARSRPHRLQIMAAAMVDARRIPRAVGRRWRP